MKPNPSPLTANHSLIPLTSLPTYGELPEERPEACSLIPLPSLLTYSELPEEGELLRHVA
jgi:hypothetical protein